MNERLRETVNRSKGLIILAIIIWVAATLLLVGPITVAIATKANFIETFLAYVKQPMNALVISLQSSIGLYFKTLLEFTVVFFVIIIVGIYKAMPKSEYENIEYGSSDWCVGGEQYRVLSPKSGIILAEKNYLPLDKLGNTNVLVIRRFRCW